MTSTTEPTAEQRADFLRRLRENYVVTVPFNVFLNPEILEMDQHGVLLRMPYKEELLGDSEQQLIHTSVHVALMDSLFGGAVMAHLCRPESIATLDLRMDYLRPAVAGKVLHGFAKVDQLTRSIAFVSGSIWQEDRDTPCALGRASFMRAANARPVVYRDKEESHARG